MRSDFREYLIAAAISGTAMTAQNEAELAEKAVKVADEVIKVLGREKKEEKQEP